MRKPGASQLEWRLCPTSARVEASDRRSAVALLAGRDGRDSSWTPAIAAPAANWSVESVVRPRPRAVVLRGSLQQIETTSC
jgi:hypothetical protein